MAVSKQQPMRPAEIELIDALDTETTNRQTAVARIDNQITTLANLLTAQSSRITTVENDISTLPVLEYGISEDNEVAAESNALVNVMFTDEKQSTPYVFIALESEEAQEGDIANCYGIITSVSATGFTARLHNLDSANAASINIIWLAIGA